MKLVIMIWLVCLKGNFGLSQQLPDIEYALHINLKQAVYKPNFTPLVFINSACHNFQRVRKMLLYTKYG
jgi:hypothetical protein